MPTRKIEPGSHPAATGFSITVSEKGPYLSTGVRRCCAVHHARCGARKLVFQEGRRFSTEAEPTALCRCGASKRKPYCDGTHARTTWDPSLTAPDEALLDQAEEIRGERIVLTDNAKYCTFARFCHPAGMSGPLRNTPTIRPRANWPSARRRCAPAARLTAWDRESGKPYEFRFEPSLGLIEDEAIAAAAVCGSAAASRCGARTAACTRSATAWCSAAADSRPTNPTATEPTPPSSGATESTDSPSAKPFPRRSTDRGDRSGWRGS